MPKTIFVPPMTWIEDEFKDELREAVVKKNMNRLGDFEDNNFYLVATLCDPRCN